MNSFPSLPCFFLLNIFDFSYVFVLDYRQRQYKLTESWAGLLPGLCQTYYTCNAPQPVKCFVTPSVKAYECAICGSYASSIIRCDDCEPHMLICILCYEQTHVNLLFHDASEWDVCISTTV